jgi:hypothetical protein
MYRALLILAVLLSSSCAYAEDNNSANFWQPKCKSLLVHPITEDTVAGGCIGVMMMLKSIGSFLQPPRKVCVPSDATIEQMLRVVTKSIDEHPERTHELFVRLAIEATQAAWPCKR